MKEPMVIIPGSRADGWVGRKARRGRSPFWSQKTVKTPVTLFCSCIASYKSSGNWRNNFNQPQYVRQQLQVSSCYFQIGSSKLPKCIQCMLFKQFLEIYNYFEFSILEFTKIRQLEMKKHKFSEGALSPPHTLSLHAPIPPPIHTALVPAYPTIITLRRLNLNPYIFC